MNIEDARRVAKLVIEHDAREAEIKRIDSRLKYMPNDGMSVCIKKDVRILDEFEINKDELCGILEYMKNRRKFINQNLKEELDRYVTKYGRNGDISWDEEDDLK